MGGSYIKDEGGEAGMSGVRERGGVIHIRGVVQRVEEASQGTIRPPVISVVRQKIEAGMYVMGLKEGRKACMHVRGQRDKRQACTSGSERLASMHIMGSER